MSDQSSHKDNSSKQDLSERLDSLEQKVEKIDSNVEDSLKLLHELETRVSAPIDDQSYHNPEEIKAKDEGEPEEEEKYKKVLKIIDAIAIFIIIFIILDGVFNGFTWMTAISQFVGQLF